MFLKCFLKRVYVLAEGRGLQLEEEIWRAFWQYWISVSQMEWLDVFVALQRNLEISNKRFEKIGRERAFTYQCRRRTLWSFLTHDGGLKIYYGAEIDDADLHRRDAGTSPL